MKTAAVSQPDLFGSPKSGPTTMSVTLNLRGLGPIPSFKNRKLIRTWMDKASRKEEYRDGHWWIRRDTIKLRSMLYLEPALQTWMDRATSLIESQLRSALATSAGMIQTAACQRSLIATLLPLDDCWTNFKEVHVLSQLCEKGEEGATITIEKL